MAMAEESFMLLSLKEKESKKLAQVIGSDTCRKILDFLTEKEFTTETDAAKELKIPLSTVHYNFKALMESGLVIADEYHYSGKGKEVPHYKLAKKFIIIAPKNEKGVMDKLKKFWPLAAVSLGVAAVMEVARAFFTKASIVSMEAASFAMDTAAKSTPAPEEVVDVAAEPMLMGARSFADESAMVVAQESVRQFPSPMTLWFLGGALLVIMTLLVWDFVKKE
jgi:DNA-binding transcriptional ArsR family regulator